MSSCLHFRDGLRESVRHLPILTDSILILVLSSLAEADMSAVAIENSAINVFPNCNCVCNPCPVKAEPAQNGSSCWRMTSIIEGVLLRTVGRHAGRGVKKGKPRNKAGDSGYAGGRAPRNDR
ncbi:hypothetical protein Tco_1120292 [Tanacetum coccineum]